MLANVMPCTSVLYSKFKLSAYSWSGSKQHYMNLRCKCIYILSFENSSVLSYCSQDWGLPQDVSACSTICFYEYANKCSFEKIYSPSYPHFQVHTFQILWALIIFSLLSDCHKLAYVS